MDNGSSFEKDLKLGQLTERRGECINVLRRSTRIPYYKKLKYGLLDYKSSADSRILRFSGFIVNISEHGVGIEGSRGFPPNFQLSVSLYTGDKTVRLEGTIKWLYHSNLEKWYMGIEIISRQDEIKKIYKNIMMTEGSEL
ncbi:MAG: PilZ domain-containing protein [Deltaproteobacteria bacterium]